jgi:PAS domain S-box-containing protein
VLYADAEGRVTDANDAFLNLVGRSRSELQSGLIHWRSYTPPAYASLDETAWSQLQSDGSCRTYRKEIQRRDGTLVPVLVGGTLTSRDPLEVVAFVVDVSELEIVRGEAIRLARIVETTPQPIISFALDGSITTWNRGAELEYGYTETEVLGKNGRFLAPDDKPGEWDRVVHTARTGVGGQFESVRKTKAGKIKPVAICVSSTVDSAGHITGGASIGTDLTNLKRAQSLEAQFQQAQKLESLGRLAGGVAHDFNNLLMVITSFAQLLVEEPTASAQLKSYADEILTAADRAASLTRQLLTFSRKQVMKLEALDINAVITETARMLERVIGEDVKLKLQLGDSLWRVEADSSQLTQVMMNLCVNARDAMPEGGVLALSTENVEVGAIKPIATMEAGEWVRLRVVDSGTGMNDVTKAKLFEPFFTTKEQGRGTGLGLSMVYGVVKQLGGHIQVETALGAGTTFSVYLPRTEKGSCAKASKSPLYIKGVETLLVVEDEHSLRSSIARYLERRGYRVLTASNGIEALHLVHTQNPRLDMVVTDLGMPEMNGRDLWKHLVRELAPMPIIFMTGYADNWNPADDAPEVTLLTKPFTLDELGRAVREALDNAKRIPPKSQQENVDSSVG